jgi:hypothetical protein
MIAQTSTPVIMFAQSVSALVKRVGKYRSERQLREQAEIAQKIPIKPFGRIP